MLFALFFVVITSSILRMTGHPFPPVANWIVFGVVAIASFWLGWRVWGKPPQTRKPDSESDAS
jgi:hypothetical protein